MPANDRLQRVQIFRHAGTLPGHHFTDKAQAPKSYDRLCQLQKEVSLQDGGRYREERPERDLHTTALRSNAYANTSSQPSLI